MNREFNNFRYRVLYTINGNELVVKDSFISSPSKIILTDGKINLKEGPILHQGMWPVAYLVIVFIVATFSFLGSGGRNFDDSDISSLILYTGIPLSAFIWWGIWSYKKFGFLIFGTTLSFESGKKLFIYRGINVDSYRNLIKEVKDKTQLSVE